MTIAIWTSKIFSKMKKVAKAISGFVRASAHDILTYISSSRKGTFIGSKKFVYIVYVFFGSRYILY